MYQAFIQLLDEVLNMKAEDVNIFGITAMIVTRFMSSSKAMTWKELAKLHNASCKPCLRVSTFSDGRDGLNFRNELFNAQHNPNHPLHKVITFNVNMNRVAHAHDDVKRGFLKGMVMQKAAEKALGSRKSKLGKFYTK